jgi:hypothetical protein
MKKGSEAVYAAMASKERLRSCVMMEDELKGQKGPH